MNDINFTEILLNLLDFFSIKILLCKYFVFFRNLIKLCYYYCYHYYFLEIRHFVKNSLILLQIVKSR